MFYCTINTEKLRYIMRLNLEITLEVQIQKVTACEIVILFNSMSAVQISVNYLPCTTDIHGYRKCLIYVTTLDTFTGTSKKTVLIL